MQVLTATTGLISGNLRGPQGAKGNTGAQGQTGPQGTPGTAANIAGATATIDNTTGTPEVNVVVTGEQTARNFAFNFLHLKGATGATALEYSQIQSFSVEPETEDTFTIQTSYCNRTPVVGDKFLCNIHGYATVAGRSWIAGCTVYSDGSTLKGQIKSLTETTGKQGQGLRKQYLHNILLQTGRNKVNVYFYMFLTYKNAIRDLAELRTFYEREVNSPIPATGSMLYRDNPVTLCGFQFNSLNPDGYEVCIAEVPVTFVSVTDRSTITDTVIDLGA